MLYRVFKTNPLVSSVLALVADLLYISFSTTSLSTALLNLLKSVGIVFSLFISILFTLAFKIAKSKFSAKLHVSTLAALFKSAFSA